jgi:polyphosphate kinase
MTPKAPHAKTLPADRFLNRELSWLEFNQRVLAHAADPSVRLLERAKFLAITGSNLDEFFMVRVGSLKLQLEQNPRMVDLRGQTVAEQLAAVDERCRRMQADQDRILADELEPRLASAGIQRLSPDQWPQAQRDAAEAYFENNTLPVLSPQAIDPEVPPPLLPGLQIHLCVRLASGAAEEGAVKEGAVKEGAVEEAGEGTPPGAGEGTPPGQFAVIPLGRSSHRIVSLPAEQGSAYVLLEDLVSDQVERFFPGREVLECVAFRISRNADVAVREDAAADLMVGIEEVLESRRESAAVRLELDERASEEATAFLCHLVGVQLSAVYRRAAPLDLSYLFQLTSLDGFDKLRDDPWPAQSNPAIDPAVPMFETIARATCCWCIPMSGSIRWCG